MNEDVSVKREKGFSLVEMLVSTAVFLPLVGAAVLLFGAGVDYYNAEQRTAQMNQEARNAVEIMSLEVAQAGTRRDITTITAQTVTGSANSQSVQVTSNKGFSVGDQVIVDPGAQQETVQLTAAGTNSLSGIFKKSRASGASVAFYGIPYLTGVVPPAGMLPNSSVTATVLKFYGDCYDDGILYYVEYAYNSATSQITKSVTPLTQAGKSTPQVLIRNVRTVTGAAGPFTLYSDGQGAVTLVKVDVIAQSTWQKDRRESRISARLAAPGVAAASSISSDNQKYGSAYTLPATPANVVTWSSP